jgi:hypothetical protein
VPQIKFRWRHGGRESPARPQPSRTPR